MTAMDVAQAHGQEKVCQILLESQRSCLGEQHTEETNIVGIDSSPVEQQTEDTDVGARDKPPVEHLTEETNVGGMKKSPQSDQGQKVHALCEHNANKVVPLVVSPPLEEMASSRTVSFMCCSFQTFTSFTCMHVHVTWSV